MLVRVLGPVDFVDEEGNNVALRGLVPTRLLALLVAGRSGDIPIDDLTVEIWSDTEPPADPVGALRTVVTRVRGVLGPESIVTGTGSYRLGDIETDVGRFQDLVERARRSSGSPTASALWQQALDLWRGPAFGDHSNADSIRVEANRLEELRAEATEAWFDARLAAGEGRELVADVEAAASEFPLREGFRAQQMTVLSRAGRQADALRAFQEFRGDMTDIGLEPSERLVDLEGQIVLGEVPRSGARRTLRGYELGERLGEGAFAIVHSARQASVDRPVAIKQIRADLADQPEFIRQFEAEAHLVARLEHPHIVPLYDYWREPGSAYLVMRHLEGGSLSSRIIDQPFTVGELAPIVSQVAAGLDEAHRSGVIHRDVKPANILLDASDNAYLSDFGIAVEEQERLDPEAWLSNGSPVYAPPEQLRREAVGPAADVHALGVSVFEALTGRLPFPTETTMAGLLERQLNDPIPLVRSSHPDTPAAVDAVLQKATAKKPTDRHQSAGEFANDFAVASGLEGDAALIAAEDRNPYKGLRAFDEADAGDFAGRDRLVSQLVAAVANERAVLVVGPSGSGKSSAVRAGLLPALRNGATAGSDRWFVTTMIPGAAPFADLAEALLRVAIDPPPDLARELAADTNGITRMIRRLIPKDREVVLVVDQFEELFTLANERDRERFLDGLAAATTDSETPFRVVATLRADFYDQPLRHPGFAKLIGNATIPVHPLAADELERAITDPARAVGARFEPGLVAEITADIADQPGALPLLQYALTELYDRRDGETMTRQAYNDLGGVSGALTRRAEEVFDASNQLQQAATRRLFGRLVNLGEGTEDTRRRSLRNEMAGDIETDASIDAYGLARLLSFDRDSATREPTVEVAHEALIREWPRLKSWLDDDRAGLRILRHLTETSTSWDQNGREPSELYRGGRLEAADEWATEHSTDLNQTEAAFLTASTDLRDAEAEAEQRTNRRLRRLLAGVGIVAVVALLAGLLAFQQQRRASDQADLAATSRDHAVTERIAADATALAGDDIPLSLLLAAEAYERDPGPVGLGALQTSLAQAGTFLGLIDLPDARSVHWLDDDTIVAATSDGIWLASVDGSERLQLSGRAADEHVLGNIGDGNTLAYTRTDASSDFIAFVPADAPKTVSILDRAGSSVVELQFGASIDDLLLVDQGAALLTIDANGTLRSHAIPSGATNWEVDAHPEATFGDINIPDESETFNNVLAADWSLQNALSRPHQISLADAESVMTSDTSILRRWSTSSGDQLGDTIYLSLESLDGFEFLGLLDDLAISGNQWVAAFRHTIFSGTLDGAVTTPLLPVETATAMYGTPKANAVRLHPNYDHALVLFSDGRIGEVAVESGALIGDSITTGLSAVTGFNLDSQGDRIAVAGAEGIGLWSMTGDGVIRSGIPRRDAGWANRVGDSLVATNVAQWLTTGWSEGAWWDVSADVPREVEPFRSEIDPEPTSETNGFGWPDVAGVTGRPTPALDFGIGIPVGRLDRYFASMTLAFEPSFWDTETGERISVIPATGSWTGQAVHPDGEITVFGMSEGAQVFDIATGAPMGSVGEIGRLATSLSFSPDGRRLAIISSDRRLHLFDWPSREPVDHGIDMAMQAVVYSPDERFLVTQLVAGDIELRDPVSLDVIRTMIGSETAIVADAEGFFFDDPGRYMISTGDGVVRMWDLDLGVQVGAPFPNAPDFRTGGRDGIELLTAVGEHIVIWDMDLGSWPDRACQAAGRNLTLNEWEQFGPPDEPYRATCPQWPSAEE